MIGTNICFDPGSANLSLWVRGKGTIISEPDIAAYDAENGTICALGNRAYSMLGKNHDWIDVIQPVRNGSVYDFQTMQTILGYYIQKVCGSKILKPNILINVPAQATVVDKRNVLDLATSAGAARMCVVESPLAAAVGAGVDCENSTGRMFVDIGAGTTDIAIIAGGMICMSRCVKTAGDEFDDCIVSFLRKEKEIIIGRKAAESIKRQIGSAPEPRTELAVPVYGKDIITGDLKSAEISSTEIAACIKSSLLLIAEEIRLLLEASPPELASDVFKNGIVFTGGSALMPGIAAFFEKKLNIPAKIAHKAQECTINGMAKLASNRNILERNGYFYKTRQELGYDEQP